MARTAEFTVPELSMLQIWPLETNELPGELSNIALRHSTARQTIIQGHFRATLVRAVTIIIERIARFRTINENLMNELGSFVR